MSLSIFEFQFPPFDLHIGVFEFLVSNSDFAYKYPQFYPLRNKFLVRQNKVKITLTFENFTSRGSWKLLCFTLDFGLNFEFPSLSLADGEFSTESFSFAARHKVSSTFSLFRFFLVLICNQHWFEDSCIYIWSPPLICYEILAIYSCVRSNIWGLWSVIFYLSRCWLFIPRFLDVTSPSLIFIFLNFSIQYLSVNMWWACQLSLTYSNGGNDC